MMKVYLCGPINGCTDDECMNWRDWFKRSGDRNEFIDPMKRDYRGRESEEYREIVELDKRDVENCDFVVVNYQKPSVGTSMEVLWAWLARKPVVVIDESGKPVSPWLRYHATAIVQTKEQAMQKLMEWSDD